MENRFLANRYRILELISEGGMGKVFKAQDTLLENQIIAVKTIKDPARKKDLEKALLDEFYTLYSLSHPNLLKVFDIGKDIDREEVFLVTELVEGLPLDEWIQGRDFSSLADVVYNSLNGLAYLHRNNIIHGDLKPAHFIIKSGDPNTLKIIDFGLVKKIETDKTTKIEGSIRYIAPEIFQGRGYSKKSDVYALGVTLFSSLYGRYPYNAKTLSKYLDIVANSTPVFDRPIFEIPEDFIYIIKKAIHPNLSVRYSDADSMLSEVCELFSRSYQPGFSNPAVFSPFVDRESEFYLLCGSIKNLLKNKNTVPFVNIYGNEGTGKRRLLRQLKVYAKYKGIEFFSARYIPALKSSLSVVRMLIPYIIIYAKNIGIDISDLKKLLNIYGSNTKYMNESGDEQPILEAENDILFSSVDLITRILSNKIPMIIIIEDYDKIDEFSRSFVSILLEAIERLSVQNSVYIILNSSEKITLNSINMPFKYIEICNFDLNNTQKMISNILGKIPVYSNFLQKIYQATGGNPLKIERLLQSLFLNKMIQYTNGIYSIRNEAGNFIDRQPRSFNEEYIQIIETFNKEQRLILGLFVLSYKSITEEDINGILMLQNMFEEHIDFIFFLKQINILKNSVENGYRVISIMDPTLHETALEQLTREEKTLIHGYLYAYYSRFYKNDYCLLSFHLYYSNGDKMLLASCIKKAIEQISRENASSDTLLFFINIAIEIQDKINDRAYINSLLQKKINTLYFLNEKDEIEKIRKTYLNDEIAVKNPLTYVSVLNSLLDIYNIDYNNSMIEELIKYADNIVSEDRDVTRLLHKINWNRVFFYLNQNKHEEALKLCTLIFEDIKDSGDNHLLSNYYGMIGELYNNMRDYKQSQYYKELALNHAYKTGIINQIAISEHNIAIGYLNLNNYDEAIRYLELAYKKFNKLRNYRLIGFTLNNLSEVIISYKNDRHLALSYAVNAFEINKIVGGINLINNYKILGITYKMLLKYDVALNYLQDGISLARSNNRMSSMLELNMVYIDILLDLSAYKEAFIIVRESKKISAESVNNYFIRHIICREGLIYFRQNRLEPLKKCIEQLKTYERTEEAFLFLYYFYRINSEKDFLGSYDYIRKTSNNSGLLDDLYIFYKSDLYYNLFYNNLKRLKTGIIRFFEFLQNEYIGNWQDYCILADFSRYVDQTGLPDIQRKALECFEFARQSIPSRYLGRTMKEKETLWKK